MKHIFFIMLIACSISIFLCAGSVNAGPSGQEVETEKNRLVVKQFADLFYRQRLVRKAFETYVTEDYIQHNPDIADGREAAILYLEPMFSKQTFVVEIKHILVDGDMAVIHLFASGSSEELGGSVMDMFRLKNGKIVEHWDVRQAVPEKAANSHPMF